MYVYVCVHVSLKVRSLLLFGVLVCTSVMCGRYMYVCVCMYVRYSFIHIGGGVGWGGMEWTEGRRERAAAVLYNAAINVLYDVSSDVAGTMQCLLIPHRPIRQCMERIK